MTGQTGGLTVSGWAAAVCIAAWINSPDGAGRSRIQHGVHRPLRRTWRLVQ